MLEYFILGIKIIFRGFFSSSYFILNLAFYGTLAVGILLFLQTQTFISYIFFGSSVLFFITTIYYDWRLNDILKQYYYFFYAINFSPFGVVILNEKNKILTYNDVFQVLCENKSIANFDELLSVFSDYNILHNTFQIGMKNLDLEDSYTKDINFGDKIWRLVFLNQFSKIGKLKIILIIDITSEIKNNSLDKMMANMLNYTSEGVIVTNRAGSIVFYNMAASDVLKISLTGKDIKTINGFQSLQPNRMNKIKYQYKNNIQNLIIHVSYHGNDYVLHRIEVASNGLDDIFMDAPFGVIVLNEDLEVIASNKIWGRFLKSNFGIEECVAPHQRESFIEYIKYFIRNKRGEPVSFNLIERNGPFVTIFPQYKDGSINLFFIEDPNAKNLKAQFLHEQRLYSLGEIVGSISHDFNNIVTTVLSNCDAILTRNTYPHVHEDYIDLMRIKQSASKAANLVKQILNISRKQSLQEVALDINESVSEFAATIGRMLGDKFDLKIQKKKNNVFVFMNEVSFEQILINLVVNARDAMPYGGAIQITTDIISIDKSIFDNGYYVTKGDYLELCIIDSGIGISQENIKKIFEPFFTTKQENGTGFGLSTVNSLVKQKGGLIKVTSKLSVGTTFSIYLPIYKDIKEEKQTPISYENINNNTNINILFAEDESTILLSTIKLLEDKGFNVVGASDGEAAFHQAVKMDNLNILITDISLPKMDGIDLYMKIKEKRKNVKVIFTSGYSDDKINLNEPGVMFLQKPYTIKELILAINKISNI